MVPNFENETGPITQLALAAKRLGSAQTVDQIVAILREVAREIVGSDGIAVVLREGDRCHYVAEDAIEPLWRGARFPLTECVSGWSMLNRCAVVIPDIESDPRVPQIAYGRTSMRSLVIVPVGVPEPVAALGAYWCALIEPDDMTMRRLDRLAHVASTAFSRVSRHEAKLPSP